MSVVCEAPCYRRDVNEIVRLHNDEAGQDVAIGVFPAIDEREHRAFTDDAHKVFASVTSHDMPHRSVVGEQHAERDVAAGILGARRRCDALEVSVGDL